MHSFLEAIEELPDNDQLELYRAIAVYALKRVDPEITTPFGKMFWKLVKPVLDKQWTNFINGKNGGAPEGNNNASKQPKNNRKTTEKQPTPSKDKEKDKEKDKDKENFSLVQRERENVDWDALIFNYNYYLEQNGSILTRLKVMTDDRKKAILKLLEKYSKADLLKFFEMTSRSDFKDLKRIPDFDWMIKEENFVRIAEGQFVGSRTERDAQVTLTRLMSE